MHHEYLDSRFLFPNSLLPLGDFLLKFSSQSLFPVSIRGLEKSNSIHDMKIIMHNQASGDVRGSKKGKINKTIPEVLDTLSMDQKAKVAELEASDHNDRIAIESNQQSTHTQVTLDEKGFVRIFQRIVTPLAGYNSKPIAISTTSLELTQYTNLLHLFQIYKQYYTHSDSKNIQALQKIIQYFHLDNFFNDTLTCSEMMTLLAMVSDARHKQAAELLSLINKKTYSSRTVSTNVGFIREKLKPHMDIHLVLCHLRNHSQVQHNTAGQNKNLEE